MNAVRPQPAAQRKARSGGAIALWGHSYGANCALGGAARGANVSHLVVVRESTPMSV
jgi:hypothetical protein